MALTIVAMDLMNSAVVQVCRPFIVYTFTTVACFT